MQNFKHFSSSPINLGIDLLALQNGGLDKSKDYCDLDLKLVCSDGYLMTHKALFPYYQSSTSSTSPEELKSCPLPKLTIIQASKLLFLVYTGDVLISKSDQTAIKPILEALEIFNVKRAPLSRGPTPTRTIKTRRSSSAGGIITSGSSKQELTMRKVAGVKKLPCGGEENVFIFGNGTVMGIPPDTTSFPSSSSSTNLVYNLNGEILLNDSSDTGFHCAPCSLIFCERSDFLEHSSTPACLNHSPPPPLTPTVKVIKLEHDFIKVEEHVNTVYFEDDPNPDHGSCAGNEQLFGGGGIPLNLCLICVTTCKNAAELMVHSKQKHLISSEKDYDYGSWTCKGCHMTCTSSELSVFLQHAYHCKKENRMSQKRSASISPPRNKRRKTQTPPLVTSNDNLTPPPITSNDNLTPSPSTPSLPPTPRTPEHLKDKHRVSQPMEMEASEPQSSSAPLESPPIIKNTFRIPKLSKLNASTPSENFPPMSTDDPNCPTPLIPRLSIKTSPQNSVGRPRRPKSLAIPNSHNRKLKLVVEEAPPLSNPPIMYKGVNITLTSGTCLPNGDNKLTTVSQPTGKKRKATEEVAMLTSLTIKKQKKTPEPKKISPWTCRRCPTMSFETQREYMHHDC